MSMIGSLGAYDRFNYGDLLFPLVLDWMADDTGIDPITHYSTSTARMSRFGARDTYKYRNQKLDSLIIGGGEALAATWRQALIGHVPNGIEWPVRGVMKSLPGKMSNSLSRLALGGSGMSPYLPDLGVRNTSEQLIVANALGASTLVDLPPWLLSEVSKSLLSMDFVSVRDSDSLRCVESVGVAAQLVPDSASILNVIQPMRDSSRSETLAFQASGSWLRLNMREVVSALGELGNDFDAIELVPIGLASGHSDLVGLSRLAQELSSTRWKSVRIRSIESIWDIAESIATCAVFVGTSLHGNITAMAYGTPSVGLSGVAKLTHYLETWGDGLTPYDVNAPSLPTAVRVARAADPKAVYERGIRLENLSITHLRSIASLVK